MYDLAIIGHGAAGLAAAVAAAERAPGARIAVLERASEDSSGGNTRWSPSNMRMRSVGETLPGFEDDMMAVSGGRGDRAYFHKLAAEAPATLQWVEQHGVKFETMDYFLSAWPTRITPVGHGAAIVDALKESAKAKGVEFHYGYHATRLHLDARGAVEAVEASDGRRLSTRAVVLASGGFQGNPEMLREHFGEGGEFLRTISPGSAANAGEGIRMALEVGALAAGDWNGMHIEPVDPRSERAAALVVVYPYGIIVDSNGQRFFDEGGGLVHETWEYLCRAIHFDASGRTAWTIVDSRLFDVAGHEGAIRSEIAPLKSETVSGLASLIGIPPNALEETIAEYNAACTGDYARFEAGRLDGLATAAGLAPVKSNWARALDAPPFFAFPIAGAIVYTFGGVATDVEARVLSAQGPIPGLFAAGEITGHFHGTAPNAVAVMRALVFGRVAGMNAIEAFS